MLTSNWKVSTGRSPQSFITFIQTTQNFVIILYIEHIETNLPIGKHTLRKLYEILKRLFQKFVSTFNLCVCFYLLHCCICISVIAPSFFYFNYLSLLGLEHIYISYFLQQPKKKRLPAASAHFTLLCFSQFQKIIFSRFCTVANYVIAPNYMLFIWIFVFWRLDVFFTREDFAVFLFYFTFPGYF